MKRRIFLAAASAVGIAGAVSGSTLVSSSYSSINTSLLLEEFPAATRIALDKFLADMTKNVKTHGLAKKYAANVAMPTQIISKNPSKQNIVYKNKAGDYISLTVVDGVEQIAVSSTL